MSLRRNVDVALRDSASIDAFCRLRVSNPVTLFDSKQIYDDPGLAANVENDPLFYDNQQTAGAGTATLYEHDKAQTVLSVSNTTAGTRIRQTKLRFNYQPGKSLMVIMSFIFGPQYAGITRREGYFDTGNGIFLEDNGTDYRFVIRSEATGAPSDALFAVQANWNIDKMDGNGKSGINLNFEKTQLLFIDFEWLGVGRVRVGFVIDGIIYYAHEFLNTNNLSIVYMSTPNLPLRSELRNDGAGPAATLTQICSTVISEGGEERLGIERCASTGNTALTAAVAGTNYVLLAMQKKSEYVGCAITIDDIDVQVQTASSMVEWSLILNPTVAGTALSYTAQAQSAVGIAKGVANNIATNGYRLAGGFAQTGTPSTGRASSSNKTLRNALRLGSTIAGVRDIICLCVKPIGGSSNVNCEGILTWHESI